ncbi:hypothetical protein OPU71_18000 [Niveibacterium sp. 24ML]|uniref:hypothetical protein n=1 Tax=Niveibacterium sp. 24ML TaxID=2985512 RepID=UPI002271EE9E|nr:hypothetical protein [Niveibacterium sp. 24ML]MCX9158022.1 hypothetical protein [Niveibacterium sp. 24ML]
MYTKHLGLPVITLALLLSGCGKVEEKATEKAAEAAIESAMNQNGAKDAKVDLSNNGISATVTDANGKQQKIELNNAKISEQETGVPFYPGATQVEGASSRVTTAEGGAVTTTLSTADALEKVAAFYSPQIKKIGAGKQVLESSEGGTQTWMINSSNGNASETVMVQAKRNGEATEITIHTTRTK